MGRGTGASEITDEKSTKRDIAINTDYVICISHGTFVPSL